jgi:hypothetical protein
MAVSIELNFNLQASDKKHRSLINMDTYPKKRIKPLKMAIATVNVEKWPGITCRSPINLIEEKKKKKKKEKKERKKKVKEKAGFLSQIH